MHAYAISLRAGSFVLLWRFFSSLSSLLHIAFPPPFSIITIFAMFRARESQVCCCRCLLTKFSYSFAATAKRRPYSPTIRRIPSTVCIVAKIAAHLSRISTRIISFTSKSGHLCVRCAANPSCGISSSSSTRSRTT